MTSESCRNGTERCNEALEKLEKKYDVVVNIRGDEPLIEPEIIDGVVKALQSLFGITVESGTRALQYLGLDGDKESSGLKDIKSTRRKVNMNNILKNLAETFDSKSWDENIVLIALIFSGSATVLFFVYLYFDKADQVKSLLDHARFELMSEVHKHLQIFSPQNRIRDGQLSKESLKSLFEKIDVNKDGKIQVSEIKDLTLEFVMLGRVKCDIHELATTLLADFDSDGDGEINKIEFEKGIKKWLKQY